MGPGDLLLLTGRTLQQATAGLRRACVYRVVPLASPAVPSFAGRCVVMDTSASINLLLNMSSSWREVEICFLFSWNLYWFEPAVYIHCTFEYTQRNRYNSLKVVMYAELQDITSISVNASGWCNH